MIQLAEKQKYGWTFCIYGQVCFFSKKLQLFKNTMQPLKPNADRGLRWKLNGKWVSYRQLKAAIKRTNE